MDRAVLKLAGPKAAVFSDAAKEFYILGEGESADLEIYRGGRDEPDIVKKDMVPADGLRFAMPLEGTDKGSLNVVTSNGFGNTGNETETLTIVYRDGKFVVAGYATSWSLREDSSDCSINFLTNRAVKREGDDAVGKTLKARFRIVPLAEWSDVTLPGLCEE
jgi:hypothetical protein